MPRLSLALADQLRVRVLSGLHLGALHPCQRLDSVRRLASEMGVDPRVALAAYQQLAAEGVVELRRRSGAFVADPLAHDHRVRSTQAEWAIECLVQGLAHGVAPAGLGGWLHSTVLPRRVRAACIECNRDQLRALCSELTNDYGLHTAAVDVADLARASAWEALERADFMVTTRFHAGEARELERVLSSSEPRAGTFLPAALLTPLSHPPRMAAAADTSAARGPSTGRERCPEG